MGSSQSALPRGLLAALSLCFFLSGFAALLYQTAWQRSFSVVFGTSELAVATVLAVYMAGLALGAALAERFLARIRRPVLVYGLLEAGIGVGALLVPLALDWAQALYATLLGNQPMPPDARGLGQSLFYVLAGFLILVLPTALMGATLPILMRSVVRTDAEVGPRAALLYGINTAGAVAGAAIAGFLLLGTLGLRGTVELGVAVNVLVFVIAAALARRFAPVALAPPPAATAGADPTFAAGCLRPLLEPGGWRSALATQPAWILPVMALSGAATFTYEVLWTRLLSHVVGGSIYAFATMLAAFLAGIALGGGLAGPFARSRAQATESFIAAQCAIALVSLAIFAFLDELLPATRGLTVNIALATAVLLPPAVAIGATFPLAVRILTPDERLAARCTARLYAWNTVGAIAGALIAGFWLIPGLGFEGAIGFTVALNLALALAAALLIRQRSLTLTATLLAALGVVALIDIQRPVATLRSSYITAGEGQAGQDLYYGVGRSSTVRLTELPTGYQLRNNGLPEAQIFARGAPPVFHASNWLGALPVVARPEATSMLVVGLGGGVAVERLAPTLNEVHVVELEEKVVTANRLISATRNHDPLADPRVTVVINDARNALRLTGRRYDIIVSQPSHPWTAGASHLFTTEFAALVKSRLAEGGVFLQWMNTAHLDAGLLKSLLATLTEVFPNVRLYRAASSEILLLAADEPLDVEAAFERASRAPQLADYLAGVGIGAVEDLLAALVLDERAARRFAAGAPVSSDDHNLMATRSRYREDGMSARAFHEAVADADALTDREFWARTRRAVPDIQFLNLALRLVTMHGASPRLRSIARSLDEPRDAGLVEAVFLLASRQFRAASQSLAAVLAADPGNQAARWLQVSVPQAAGAGQDPSATRAALGPVPAAVLAGLGHERAGNWSAVAPLDPVLAEARRTEPWYPDAVRLRAAWRLQPGTAEREARAAEALALLDSLLPLRSDPPLLVQRAHAAAVVGDAPAALESAAFVAEHARLLVDNSRITGRPLAPAERAGLARSLQAMSRLLQAHPQWRRDHARGPAVYAAVEETRTRLLAS